MSAYRDVLSERRRREVDTETARFETFCSELGCPPTVDSAPLYLTWRSEQGADARAIQRAVGALNTAARLRNEPSWSESETVSRWLQGFHRMLRIGAHRPVSEPVYSETVLALAEVCLHPTRSQRLAVAAMILTNATGLPPIALGGLKWSDVRIRASKGCVEVDPPPFKRRGPRSNTPLVVPEGPPGACLITALRDLKHDRSPSPYVFEGNGGEASTARVARYLDAIPGRGPGLWPRPTLTPDQLAQTLSEARRPTPAASRDLALVVISHHLALTSREAVNLHQRDFTQDGQTVTVEIPGRRDPVHLRATGSLTCPLKAWTAWSWHLNDQAQDCPDSPLFRVIFDGRIWDKAMTEKGLNRSFQARAHEALLTGEYTYVGLRSGAIRGWLREGVNELHVAHRAGLASLSAVAMHERRESMITKSVAGQVGL